MRIARPRLLAGSLAAAVVIGIGGGFLWASVNDDAALDARLDDPQSVVTFPNDGLVNADLRGDPLPLVSLGDRDGNEVQTASFIGQPLVINLWFSTCGPCAKELPDFAEVHAERGDDVRFIGVNPQDSVETMDRFARDRDVQYELYLDDFAEFTDAVGAVSFPVTLFVTADGRIVSQTGAIEADELRSEIDQLLEVDA